MSSTLVPLNGSSLNILQSTRKIDHFYPDGKKITDLKEAENLPKGTTKLSGDLVPPEQRYKGTDTDRLYSRSPYILGDRVIMRSVETEIYTEQNKKHGEIAQRRMEDGEQYCHRIYAGGTASWATKVKPMYRGEDVHLFPPAFQEIEINGKKGIIFTANHENRSPMLFYYADGDQKIINQLKKLYAENYDLEIDETTDGIGDKVKMIFNSILKRKP